MTRFVERARAAGWLGVERLGGNGMQVFWLRKLGAEMLAAAGSPAADLFPASGPVAAKDFNHSVAVGEAAIWLATHDPVPDELLPAWALERHLGGKLAAIPDLLALWRNPGAALAVEVDLGTEPLQSVFLPKLRKLCDMLDRWFSRAPATILVLVLATGRKSSLLTRLGPLASRIAIEVIDDVCR